jgi:hypothetical protein
LAQFVLQRPEAQLRHSAFAKLVRVSSSRIQAESHSLFHAIALQNQQLEIPFSKFSFHLRLRARTTRS